MATVLFLPSGTTLSASSRYRVHQYLEPLRSHGFRIRVLNYPQPATRLARFKYFSRLLMAAATSDIIFIQKRLFPRFLPLLALLRSKLVYDFDDALFATTSAARQSRRQLENDQPSRHNRGLHRALKSCHHVIAGNAYLASYARSLNKHVSVLPTVVDLSRYPARQQRPDSGRICIGWVGNSENLIYLLDLAPVLVGLTQLFANGIQLCVISDRPPRLPSEIPLQYKPWNLDHEVEDLLMFDVGLMPLRDDTWTRGKCAFKAIQYMAIGIPTVASPVGANKDLIQHDVNGFLAADQDEWTTTLTRLVKDGDLRQRVGAAGRDTIAERYSLEKTVPRLAEILGRLAPRHS